MTVKSQIDIACIFVSEIFFLNVQETSIIFVDFFLFSKKKKTLLYLLSLLIFIVMISIINEIIITICDIHSIDMIYHIWTYFVDNVIIVLS